MLNERPEGKDKFGYVLIGLLVAFVIILVTSAVIWNSNHPEKVQENFEKIDTQQAEEKKGAKLGPYTIQLKDKKVVDCVGGALYTYSGINVGSVKPTLTYERGALIREEVQTFSLWPLLLNGYRYSKARGVHVQHQCSGCGS